MKFLISLIIFALISSLHANVIPTRIHKHPIRKIVNQIYVDNIDKYNCIVKISNMRSTCTASFINNKTLVTAAHCISRIKQKFNPKNPYYYIKSIYESNSFTTSVYRVMGIITYSNLYKIYLFDNMLDVAYIEFENFIFNCNNYFTIFNGSIPNNKLLRTCAYGINNRITDRSFGCMDLNITNSSSIDMRGVGLKGSYISGGDSGGPIFDSNYTIYGVNSRSQQYPDFNLSIMNVFNTEILTQMKHAMSVLKNKLKHN